MVTTRVQIPASAVLSNATRQRRVLSRRNAKSSESVTWVCTLPDARSEEQARASGAGSTEPALVEASEAGATGHAVAAVVGATPS